MAVYVPGAGELYGVSANVFFLQKLPIRNAVDNFHAPSPPLQLFPDARVECSDGGRAMVYMYIHIICTRV